MRVYESKTNPLFLSLSSRERRESASYYIGSGEAAGIHVGVASGLRNVCYVFGSNRTRPYF